MTLAKDDRRIVMTLDAGGTNFVFSAMQGFQEIIEPIALKAQVEDLDACIALIVDGFQQIKQQLNEEPVAISFAFPGPADYPNGIIGDLPNLPAFTGGVALGPLLEAHFGIPVFINNDGNLFAYGEATMGVLPLLNDQLKAHGSKKRFQNMVGITLGTGFGVGLVANGQLILGDNANGGEGWKLRDYLQQDCSIETHISREGLRLNYAKRASISIDEVGDPFDIYQIAKGQVEGNKAAALETFSDFGTALGEALATVVTLLDGIVVLGGGVSKAYDLFAPAMLAQMNDSIGSQNGIHDRLVHQVFNLEDSEDLKKMIHGKPVDIKVYGTDTTVTYDSMVRTGVGLSKNKTDFIIAQGAYAFALNNL